MDIGIDRLAWRVPDYALPLATLARVRGVDPGKYTDGLGQEVMAVAPPDEDIVTLAAAAAEDALEGVDPASLEAVIVATESGIDQSKAAAIYVHRLLGLPSRCQAFEIKQACCGSTAALRAAIGIVAADPSRRVLVIGSDIARYEPGSPGEPTQGAGAVAILVSTNPRLLVLDSPWGSYTEDVMDFWRPAYRDEALVDGKLSIRVYLRAMEEAWLEYARLSRRTFADHGRFCYHLPFTRMAAKAHAALARLAEAPFRESDFEAGLRYGRLTGNLYTGSLYLALSSLLETEPADLAGQRIALFSYGSGCMGTWFSGRVVPGYRDRLRMVEHAHALRRCTVLTMAEYEAFQRYRLPTDGRTEITPHISRNPFRLAGISGHRRDYVDMRKRQQQPERISA